MKYTLPVVLTASMLAGCAAQSTGVYEKPDGEAFKTGGQHRVASVSHWQLIAENEAKLLARKTAGKPVFVEKNQSSNFSRTYYNFLTSSLVQNGANIFTEKRPGNTKVTYDSQVVRMDGGRQKSGLHGDFPLPITGVVYYLLSEVTGVIKVIPGVVTGEMVKNLSSATEVIITTQATQDAKILYSTSNVYYIEGVNQWDYLLPPPSPPAPVQVSPSEWMWNWNPNDKIRRWF